jgi:hypothetical protein
MCFHINNQRHGFNNTLILLTNKKMCGCTDIKPTLKLKVQLIEITLWFVLLSIPFDNIILLKFVK